MATLKNQNRNNRLVIAGALFLTSILASAVFAYISQSGASYWALNRTIPEGARIEQADLLKVVAKIDHRINGYLPATQNLSGTFASRRIRAGEILRSDSISREENMSDQKSLSILIRASDIPSSAKPGDIVSIYQVGDTNNGVAALPPTIVLRGVFIEDIARKSVNFGSDVSITISLSNDDVLTVLAATSSGRIVVVPSHG